MKPIVSVVIPVYQVEATLKRCVDSVLAQTLADIEIILVDDGSTDESPVICDEYARNEERVHVIHKSNGGLASARNAGMDVAKGRYLFFVDSDDWMDPDGLEVLVRIAEEYKVDFVRYRALRSGWPGMEAETPVRLETVRELRGGYYEKKQILEEVIPRLLATEELTMGPIVGAWASLYDRTFLVSNQIRFPEKVRFGEDLLFSARVVRAAESFYYRDDPGIYHYWYNPASISKSFRKDRWLSCKETARLAKNEFGDAVFSAQMNRLQWFLILLALGERHYLPAYHEKVAYCREILQDPVLLDYDLELSGLRISWKQRLLLRLIRAKRAKWIALV